MSGLEACYARAFEPYTGPLSPQALMARRKRRRAWRHGQGPVHRYGLADFGLDEDAIEATCGGYLDEFGVTRERGG